MGCKRDAELSVDGPIVLGCKLQLFVIDPEPGPGDLRCDLDARRHGFLDLLQRRRGFAELHHERLNGRYSFLPVFGQTRGRHRVGDVMRDRTGFVPDPAANRAQDNDSRCHGAPGVCQQKTPPGRDVEENPRQPRRRLPFPTTDDSHSQPGDTGRRFRCRLQQSRTDNPKRREIGHKKLRNHYRRRHLRTISPSRHLRQSGLRMFLC